MTAVIQIQVCGTQGLNDKQFSVLKKELDKHFLHTALEGADYHLAHYDWGREKKFRGHINIDILNPSEEESKAWKKITGWEGKQHQLLRGIKNIRNAIAIEKPSHVSDRKQSALYGLGQVFDAITRHGHSGDYAFQETVSKVLQSNTDLGKVRIQTGRISTLRSEYEASDMIAGRAAANRMGMPYMPSPSRTGPPSPSLR